LVTPFKTRATNSYLSLLEDALLKLQKKQPKDDKFYKPTKRDDPYNIFIRWPL